MGQMQSGADPEGTAPGGSVRARQLRLVAADAVGVWSWYPGTRGARATGLAGANRSFTRRSPGALT